MNDNDSKKPAGSVADAKALLRQFPFRGYPALALHLLFTCITNGFVLWLVLSGRISNAGLIALVIGEAALLLAISKLATAAVPRRDWLDQPQPWRERLPVLAFATVWCGLAYSFTLLAIKGWSDLGAYFSGAAIWWESGLIYALAITTTLAGLAALKDWMHYRRHGAPFVTSVTPDALARVLTVLLGAIPFAMPFFAATIGGFKVLEWSSLRAATHKGQALLGVAAVVVGAVLIHALIKWLLASGVGLWAIGYVAAKLIAELLVVMVPLALRQAANAPAKIA